MSRRFGSTSSTRPLAPSCCATVPDYEPARRFFFMYPRTALARQWWMMTFPEVKDYQRFAMAGGGLWRLFDAATHEVVEMGSNAEWEFAGQRTPAWGPFPNGLILQASREPLAVDFTYPTTLRCGMADLLRFVQDEQEWRGDVGRFVYDEYRRTGTWLAEQPPPAIGSSFAASRRATPVPEGHRIHDGPGGTVPSWLAGPLRGPLPFHDNDVDATEEERAWLRRAGVPSSYYEPLRPRLPGERFPAE
jgi:hypothetical protein